jgi:hypothetical protein
MISWIFFLLHICQTVLEKPQPKILMRKQKSTKSLFSLANGQEKGKSSKTENFRPTLPKHYKINCVPTPSPLAKAEWAA